MRLQDKRVVVIGGSSGIGLAAARMAASEGAAIGEFDHLATPGGEVAGGPLWKVWPEPWPSS